MRNDIYKTDEIATAAGNKFRVEYLYDDISEAPWKWADGHGVVSDWTSRDKRPGEVVLCVDRSFRRYYDMQGAIKTARADHWSYKGVLSTDTKGQKAVKAAQSDFNYLRAWWNQDWWYCCLRVVMLGADAADLDGYEDYLGRVEHGYGRRFSEYAKTTALEMAHDIESQWLKSRNAELVSELHDVKNHALFVEGIL